ncbi:hypothetical protein WKI68_21930 [Streptomyces sp. MS1.HAVA.3]|uniref:Uncharacterized protein n=1 Tax=Streptomyces caledonius TaxID=3134107 RepID=A0ABU8U7Q6_9ACTN
MTIPWRSSAEALAQTLRQQGVDPDAVRDVDAAWDAFGRFLQLEIDGIEGPENDGDGFIVEWGRWDWNDGRPALSFGRLLAVSEPGDVDDADEGYWQPEYWKAELELVFGRIRPGLISIASAIRTPGSTTTGSVSAGRPQSQRCAASSSPTPHWQPCGGPSPRAAQ